MNEKEHTVPGKHGRKHKTTSEGAKSLGPVPNLEEHVHPEWWRQIFNATYLKTDGDVVDDPQVTSKEVDVFCGILNMSPSDKILDLCCGQGRVSIELAKRGFSNVEGVDRSHYLIQRAKTLKPQSVNGPLIAMDMDLGSYLQFIAAMVPQSSGLNQPIPKLGRMYMTFDFKDGTALSSSTVNMQDIKKMVALMTQGAFGTTQAEMSFTDQNEEAEQGAETNEKEAASDETPPKDADDTKEKANYWFRKGALCSTYGNNEAAVKYFQKAISLDPGRSGAYFEQGVSYGQLGDYQKAIPLLNKAIGMEPQNGMYYYGRGRVYLLADDNDKAMADFNKAAELGDEDALNYLKYIEQSLN